MPPTVLVVEDHELQRRILIRQLRLLGVTEILEADDGLKALALLRERGTQVDLILCDLDMPNMDGMAFVRRLAELDIRAAYAITSARGASILSSVGTMCQAYGLKPLGTIEKPVVLDDLCRLLEQAASPVLAQPKARARVAVEWRAEQIVEAIRAGQFEPFYQAKVSLQGGAIAGAEALARWRHPALGIITPDAFVDRLERAGQIDELTFCMLSQASAACRRWQAEGLALTVSVNLSLSSLADTGLAERLEAIVRDTGLDCSSVTLEVTETASMTEVAPALENLARLRLRGFGLSIDDFGTGFASMQQLGRAAFTELKIDRSFVAHLTDKAEARAIVQASIDIARKLGITAVAEGVETTAQWQALEDCGCHLAQGFLISRPTDEDGFLQLCRESAR